jgi:DNA-binding SARP family transcriptional activator
VVSAFKRCYNHRVIEFRLLGQLEAERDGELIQLAGQKQRALLAALLVRAGEVVSTDRLIDDLWGEEPPRTAGTSLQNFVSQLRKLLGPEVLVTRAPGYALAVEPAAVDAARFERLVAEARGSDPAERVEQLRAALSLWRGEPLAEFAYAPFAEAEIRRLEELRLSAVEEVVDAELELGRHTDVIGELEPLVQANPLRERMRGQLMLALYRTGRQAEALQSYQDARVALVEGLGIDPGPALQRLHGAILRQDDALSITGLGRGSVDEDHYDEVVRAAFAGRLICVLGAGISDQSFDHSVVEQLAARFGVDAVGGLSRVAQLVTLKQGVGALYDELHDTFVRERLPGEVHAFAASLPKALRAAGAPNPLLLTTHYDDALERALEAEGEEFDVVSYVAAGRDRGKFIHTDPSGASSVIEVPNAYAELALERRTIVVKLHGQVDANVDRARESFVVSEDDYIDYLAQSEIASLVPVTIAAKLRRSHFLFFGYALEEWQLRVFLHRIWGREQVAYRSWSVQAAGNAVERDFWGRRGVDLVDADLADYVQRLGRRLHERGPVEG